MTPIRILILLLQLAGVVQLAIVAANFVLPHRLGYSENLDRVSPIIRQIFIVHTIYILFVLIIFSAICLLFAPDLAGASVLGRFLSGALALFWLARVFIQLLYYDPEVRRKNRGLDVAFAVALCFLAGVFSTAALGLVG